jgi:hypothetical protein
MLYGLRMPDAVAQLHGSAAAAAAALSASRASAQREAAPLGANADFSG